MTAKIFLGLLEVPDVCEVGLNPNLVQVDPRECTPGILEYGAKSMQNCTLLDTKSDVRFYGLDVHQDTISISVCYGLHEPQYLTTINNTHPEVEKYFQSLLDPNATIYAVYEAGGCGFVLYRMLEKMGIQCIIAAPSKITKTAKEAKNDKLDSLKLAKLLRNHILLGGKELHEVHVPDETTEAIREVTRQRDFCKRQAKRLQSRIQGMLRKHGFRYNLTKTLWTKTYRDWLERLDFRCPIKQRVFCDLLNMLHDMEARVECWDKELKTLCEQWNKGALVKALCALKGIQLLSAMILVAEISDFGRFEQAKHLMAFLGLVPSEYSSGQSVTRGCITKTGNKRVRTLLIEAAQTATRKVKSKKVFFALPEAKGVPVEVLEHAYKAQTRLNKVYYRLIQQGKNSNVAKVAVARELAGFIWGIAVIMDSLPQSNHDSSSSKKVA